MRSCTRSSPTFTATRVWNRERAAGVWKCEDAMKRSHSLACLAVVWSAGLLSAAAAWQVHHPVVIPDEARAVSIPSAAVPVQSDEVRVAQPVTIVGHVSSTKASHDPLRHCSEWKDLEQGSGQVRI